MEPIQTCQANDALQRIYRGLVADFQTRLTSIWAAKARSPASRKG
jgi:hypothetical protein